MPSFSRWFLITAFVFASLVALGRAAAEEPFQYPPEWSPQAATWIGWPAVQGPPGSDYRELMEAQANVRTEMVKALTAAHNNVVLQVTNDNAERQVRQYLTDAGVPMDKVSFQRATIEDTFVRDIGPRFLTDGKTLEVADIPWTCYGFPRQAVAAYFEECLRREDNDNQMAAAMGLAAQRSVAVSEGGALDATSTLLMGYLNTALQRNPYMTQAEIEADYLKTYGKEKMIWLRTAPISDRPGYKAGRFYGWGANGHVDEYARFVNETTVVIAQIDDPTNDLARADQKTLLENLEDLKAARTVEGEPLTVVTMPSPDHSLFAMEVPLGSPMMEPSWAELTTRHAPGDMVLYSPAVSYMNFVIANGVVLVPAYWQEGLPDSVKQDDQRAAETLAGVFPDRKIVQINPLAINWWGGGMHCSTQQQPAVITPSP